MTGGKTTTTAETTGNNAAGTNTKNELSQTIKNGGHFMIMNRADEVSVFINQSLKS